MLFVVIGILVAFILGIVWGQILLTKQKKKHQLEKEENKKLFEEQLKKRIELTEKQAEEKFDIRLKPIGYVQVPILKSSIRLEDYVPLAVVEYNGVYFPFQGKEFTCQRFIVGEKIIVKETRIKEFIVKNKNRKETNKDFIVNLLDKIEEENKKLRTDLGYKCSNFSILGEKFLGQKAPPNSFNLFHMTDIHNLENILENGLLSHNNARKNNLTKVDISDNEVNARRTRIEPIFRKSIHDYVPLYFNPRNPMLYVRKYMQNNIVILGIDPIVLGNENTIFTDGNAAANKTTFYKEIDDLKKLNWKCVNADYWSEFTDGKRIRCAEVLVPEKLPISMITSVFHNESSNSTTHKKLKEILKYYPHISIRSNSGYFFDTERSSYYDF